MIRPSSDAIVVGGGVVGLTTAVCLVDAGLSVRVWSADDPVRTASYAAGAMYSPFLTEDERITGWATQTFERLEGLAKDAASGVAMVPGREVSRVPVPVPTWAVEVPDFRMCAPEELPAGFWGGWSYTVPIVTMPIYLEFLRSRLRAAGVVVEHRVIAALSEPAAEASIVVNCTGMGARRLVPDPLLRPIRGELLVVRNPGIETFTADHASDGDELTYLLPHGDVVVLGGTADHGRHDCDPDPRVAEGIIARCSAVEPLLRNAEVIEHRVGIRPARTQVRVERDDAGIVHNYGHGGSGVSVSWGCAAEVTRIATQCFT